jgi:hypothetical protein
MLILIILPLCEKYKNLTRKMHFGGRFVVLKID